MTNECRDCKNFEGQIEDLLEIFQLVYNNSTKGLNAIIDNETALRNIINLVKDYVKEE